MKDMTREEVESLFEPIDRSAENTTPKIRVIIDRLGRDQEKSLMDPVGGGVTYFDLFSALVSATACIEMYRMRDTERALSTPITASP